MGNQGANLARARLALAGLDRVKLGYYSPVYRSDPQDVRNQPWFANQVACLYCGPRWTADGLLQALLAIEADMGRVRWQNRGPRLIDLDLLLFNGQCFDLPDLILPHPRMENRAFVLIPLRDIAPDLVLPNGRSLSEALQKLSFSLEGRCIRQS